MSQADPLALRIGRWPLLGRMLACALAGAASAFAFAPFHAAPLLFITLPLLYLAASVPQPGRSVLSHRLRDGFAIAWAFGFGFHFVGLHWIGNAFLVQADIFAWALPFAVTLLPAGLAIFYGLVGVIVLLLPRGPVWPITGFVLALWAAEWLRSVVLTGFPWNVLGYALAWPLPLLQTIAWAGLHGLTVIVLVLALAPYLSWSGLFRHRLAPAWALIAAALTAAVPLALLYVAGSARLTSATAETHDGVRLRIVQPSIDQTEKWQPARQADIFERHLNGSAVAPLTGITHIVWAEAAMPFRPLESAYALQRLAELIPDDTQLVTGFLRTDRLSPDAPVATDPAAVRVYNSTGVLDSSGRLTVLYDKRHLVPFGEYLPWPGFFQAIGFETLVRERGGFATGDGPRTNLAITGLPPVEVLICYEAIFPHEVAVSGERPGLLLNLTNDGWFGTFSGPYQHFEQTRARAVELGIPLLRVSNNGISAMVDAHGRVTGRLALNETGMRDVALPVAIAPTTYATHRDLPAILMAAGLLLAALAVSFLNRMRAGRS